MPKKKKSKETSNVEFRFDYRYTPKPYFTASPTSNGLNSPVSKSSSTSQPGKLPDRPSSGLNTDAWKSQRPNAYNYNRSYAKAANSSVHSPASGSSKNHLAARKSTPVEGAAAVDLSSGSSSEPAKCQADRDTMKKMFAEMFKGRIEAGVIDIILQQVNWNESQALDAFSQMASPDNSHLYPLTGFGALTPHHNLTPTAPTLSYCSSVTSLDEFGLEVTRNQTQRNLSEVANMLENSPGNINDLDRQKLARSRATTPKTLLRNGTLTSKNISLGSTESLESNRSLEPSTMYYGSLGTPKKTNTMTLHDMSSVDDIGITMSLAYSAQDQPTLGAAASDPGQLVIPVDHGDIVLEKGTYDNLCSGAPQPNATLSAGPLSHGASIAEYSEAISSLTTQLHTEVSRSEGDVRELTPDRESAEGSVLPAAGLSSANCPDIVISDVKTLVETTPSFSYSASATQSQQRSGKENQYPYNGILSSGTAVPTAFESARPKVPKMLPPGSPDSVLAHLLEVAASGSKVMIILRGVSGSGKTTMGRKVVDATQGQMFSADDYFINSRGEYSWSAHLLPEAHAACKRNAKLACEAEVTPILIDNTNLEMFEMESYVKLCLQFGYRPILAEPDTTWKYNAKDLSRKNTHKVSFIKIKQMLERFDRTVTVEKLIDLVVSKDQNLAAMAEQFRSPGTKLSRKKPLSKTMKRNKQHETVEKLKDKKVDEFAQQQNPVRVSAAPQAASQKDSEDEDNQVETEIMYPNTSISGFGRKNTIKVLNSDAASSNTDDSQSMKSKTVKVKRIVHSKSDMLYLSKSSHSDGSDTTASLTASTPLTSSLPADSSLELQSADSGTVAAAGDMTSPTVDETGSTAQGAEAVSTAQSSETVDKSVSVDSDLNRAVDTPSQSQTVPSLASHSTLSSAMGDEHREVSGSAILSGSVTLPRPIRSSSTSETIPSLSQTASLPRTKKESSKPKRSSTAILCHDQQETSRWMSNDWATPPYPLTLTPVADPPPPYQEIAPTVHLQSPSAPASDVKHTDQGTLTEPSDYAMAFKAMQYNQALPEGWLLVTGRSKKPFPPVAVNPVHKPVLVTHDKGTMTSEDDKLALSDCASLEESTQDKLTNLHACFPQIPKDQLAGFLELCHGDEVWATNLLLDSNKEDIPKVRHMLMKSSSVPGTKKSRAKYKTGKLVKRFNKALGLPVPKCLGRVAQPTYPSPNQTTVGFSLTASQVSHLHSVFGQNNPPPVMEGDLVDIEVPRWVAHRLYRCVMSSPTDSDLSNAESDLQATIPPVEMLQPPPKYERSPSTNSLPTESSFSSQPDKFGAVDSLGEPTSPLSHVSPEATDSQEYITSSNYSLEKTALAGWSLVDAAPDTSRDEELARKLRAEELLSGGHSQSVDQLSLITDEQLARSLAAEDALSHNTQDLSSKLKRRQLGERYPQVDSSFLDEVFAAYGNNLEASLNFLSEHHGPSSNSKAKVSSPPVPSHVAKADSSGGASATPISLNGAVHGDDQWFDMEEYENNAGYSEFRAEALIHMEERKKYEEKARTAFMKKQFDVGYHYGRMAQDHKNKEKEANFQAASQIFKHNNSNRDRQEADLHGLHPQEAVLVVEQIILAKRRGKEKYVYLVTGRGNHSKGGVAKVRNAVLVYLNRNNIQYSMSNPGMIRVVL